MLTGLRRPWLSTPPTTRCSRRPSMGSAVAAIREEPNAAEPAPLYRGAKPPRRHGQPSFHYAPAYLGGGCCQPTSSSTPTLNDPEVSRQEPRRSAPYGADACRLEDPVAALMLSDLDPLRAGCRPAHSMRPRPYYYQPRLRDAHRPGRRRRLRYRRRAFLHPRPLRPTHLRPERSARASTRGSGHAVRHRQLRPLGPPRHPSPAQDRGRLQKAHPAPRPRDRRVNRRPRRARPLWAPPWSSRWASSELHPAHEQRRRPPTTGATPSASSSAAPGSNANGPDLLGRSSRSWRRYVVDLPRHPQGCRRHHLHPSPRHRRPLSRLSEDKTGRPLLFDRLQGDSIRSWWVNWW